MGKPPVPEFWAHFEIEIDCWSIGERKAHRTYTDHISLTAVWGARAIRLGYCSNCTACVIVFRDESFESLESSTGAVRGLAQRLPKRRTVREVKEFGWLWHPRTRGNEPERIDIEARGKENSAGARRTPPGPSLARRLKLPHRESRTPPLTAFHLPSSW